MVVMVSVVFAAVVLGVTVAGLNWHAAIAGSPLQEKLIGLVNDPCGVAVKTKTPDCPAVTVALGLLGANVKSAAPTWKLWSTGVAAA